MYDVQRINSYLLSEFKNKKHDLESGIYMHNILILNISLIDIETSLYDSYYNYNNGLFLFTPNKLTLYFNFTYSESTRGVNGTALLELKIDTLKIKFKNDKINQKLTIKTKMVSPKENYDIPGIKDKDFLALLQDSFFWGFQMQSILSRTIPNIIDAGLEKYYNDFYSRKKEFSIQTTEFFGNLKFSMQNNKFLYFCEDLLSEYKNIFCYYIGYTGNYKDNEDKTKVPLVNERFSHNEDNLYNIFLNKDLIYNISKNISLYLLFHPKRYDNKTNTKELSYDFTIGSLKKFFSGLDDLKDNEYFYCQIFMNEMKFNDMTYSVSFNINEKLNFIIRIYSKIDVDIPITKNVRFNFCLKEAKSANIEIMSVSQDIKIEIKNMDDLKKAIDESFDYDNNKFCLFDDGISMKDYYSKIKNIYFRDEGLYFEGDHLYQ
jgi:hypothetical protein